MVGELHKMNPLKADEIYKTVQIILCRCFHCLRRVGQNLAQIRFANTSEGNGMEIAKGVHCLQISYPGLDIFFHLASVE